MEQFGLLTAVLVALGAAVGTGHLLARSGFPVPDASRRIGCIDGLRGYLALLVMMHHFDLWISYTRVVPVWGYSSSRLFANFGPGGVALFFMTTGLVFYPRIERGFRRIDWRATYLSRIFRILPLQAVLVCVAAAISLAMTRDPDFGLASNLRSFAMWLASYGEPPLFGYQDSRFINAGVLWSLWFEWVFYLITLPLLAVVRDYTRDRLPSIVIPLAAFAVGAVHVHAIGRWGSLFYLPLFALGMIAWELRNRRSAHDLLTSRAATIIAAVLLAAAMIWAPGPFRLPQILAYGLFFCCVANGNAFGGVLAWRGSVVLGEMSFGIYLIHGTVLFILFNLIAPSGLPLGWVIACLPVAAVVVVLASAAAHLLIERPGIALGKRLSGRPRERLSPRVEQATLDVAP